MGNYIQQALIISMTVLFIHATTWEGMIFQGIKRLIKPERLLAKPIYGCPICMTPWWSALIYLFILDEQLDNQWLKATLIACGFSVITSCILMIRDAAIGIDHYMEHKEEMWRLHDQFKRDKLGLQTDDKFGRKPDIIVGEADILKDFKKADNGK